MNQISGKQTAKCKQRLVFFPRSLELRLVVCRHVRLNVVVIRLNVVVIRLNVVVIYMDMYISAFFW